MSSINVDETPESSLTDPEPPDDQGEYQFRLENIARNVKNHRCILFLGSAIHAPSTPGSIYHYSKTEAPPFGEDLSLRLADKCNYLEPDRNRNLPRVSWYYEFRSGFRQVLLDEVVNIIQFEDQPSEPDQTADSAPHQQEPRERKPSPVLRGLARLGFPIVITTNYDQLYERALEMVAQERSRKASPSEKDVIDRKPLYKKCVYTRLDTIATGDCDTEPSAACPYILKIHGDVDQRDSIVITDEDYIEFVLRMGDKELFNPVAHNVRTHLKEWPILFIGYRLYDYNLRLLFKTLRRQLGEADKPPSFAIDRKPDVLIRDMWDKKLGYVRFIEKDLWSFVPDLYKKVTGQVMPP